jgi:hypothetical protein
MRRSIMNVRPPSHLLGKGRRPLGVGDTELNEGD